MTFPLAQHVVTSIVSQPEAVSFALDERQGKHVLVIRVAGRDVAKVMGSRGLVIRAIRTVLSMIPGEFEDVVVEGIEG